MTLSIILTTALTTFATSPDLCADVYLDETGAPIEDALGQTLSKYCQWSGPDSPILDSDVCCTIDDDGAHCSLPDPNGRCSIGYKMWCEYGVASGGAVTCQQAFPSVCDNGGCQEIASPDSGPVEDVICCVGGTCFEVETWSDFDLCADLDGYMGFCIHGVQNLDGTIDCLD